jgi:hypothetical protein
MNNRCSKISSTLQEESLQQIVSGICDPNVILQNLSEQDICFGCNLREWIDREGNSMDLFDQHDSKGQTTSISSQEGLPIDHGMLLTRNVLIQLPEFPALVVLSNEIWNILENIFVPIYVQSHMLSAIQQLQRYAVVFQHVLAYNQYVLEEATQIPLNCYESLLWIKKQFAILSKGLQSVRPLLKSIDRLAFPNYISQDNECVKAMMTIPAGEHGPGSHCRPF